jgi:hypothetical protein
MPTGGIEAAKAFAVDINGRLEERRRELSGGFVVRWEVEALTTITDQWGNEFPKTIKTPFAEVFTDM